MPAKIDSSIEINAPIARVWEILADLDSYHEWNPFTPKIETSFEIGSPVILHVNMNPGKKLIVQEEEMLRFEEGHEMAWGIRKSWYVKTDRWQRLEVISENQTRYLTTDIFWGPLVPLIMLMFRKKIQHGFDATARALKERAETTLH